MRAVEENYSQDTENTAEIFPLQLSVHALDDSQFVTLRLESGSHIRFQVDTGAQCNVIPLNTYKKATGDVSLEKVTLVHTQIRAYGGSTLPIVGTVRMRVWRGNKVLPRVSTSQWVRDPATARTESMSGNEDHCLPGQ